MQNKLLRFLNGTNVSDKVNTTDILNKLNLLSVSQMNAQSKLTEAWKINNITNYPTKWDLKSQQKMKGSPGPVLQMSYLTLQNQN